MTDTSTDAVKKLLDGVTPGPWQSDGVFMDRDHEVRVAMPDDCGVPMATIAEAFHNWNDVTDIAERRISWKEAEANARFIAAARDLVPALLAERDALRGKLEAAVAIADNALNAVTEVQNYKQPDDPWTENALTMQELDIFDFDASTARATIAKIKGADHE